MKNADKKGHRLARRLRRDIPPAEDKLWQELRRKQIHGFHFRRQHPIGPYVADFACVKAKLVVEADGYGHSETHEIERDKKRTVYINKLGWRVIRFRNEDIYEGIDCVVEAIAEHLMGVRHIETING